MKPDVDTGTDQPVAIEQQDCPGCGMSRDAWRSRSGYLDSDDGKTYCCEGCATADGCTCD